MTGHDGAPQIADLDGLLEFREITERIAGFLQKRVKGHLAALTPLLSPARLLGKHVGGRESGGLRADEMLTELTEKFSQSCGNPFNIKAELDETTLTSIGSKIEVYPFEYNYEAKTSKGAKQVAMTSPVRWVVSYGSEYTLSQLRTALNTPGERRMQPIRQFVANSAAFQLTIGKNPTATQLLNDLRYEINVQTMPGLGHLQLVTIGIQVPSFRPPDDLLLTAMRLSGVSAFIELIDTNAVRTLEDPFRAQIVELLDETPAAQQ